MEAPVQSEKADHAELARLFGPIKSTPDVVPVKESTLSIRLVASYVGGKGRSAAVIASSENKHKLYYQGDKLMPGVELVKVQARRVLIKRNGVLESVSLEERQPAAALQSNTREMARKPGTVPVDPLLGQQKLVDKLNKLKALASGEM
jgi:type II secretory pathway component PulC